MASRWVILGSRLLSPFPVAIRDRARYRQVLGYALKRLPSSVRPSNPRPLLAPLLTQGLVRR
jgi:hypothetical protein